MGGTKTDASIESEKKGPLKLQKQLHRTRLCTYFLRGDCPYGARCAYAHTSTEIESAPDFRKTRLCKAFQEGECKNPKCDFAHGLVELRSTQTFYKKAPCMWYAKGCCRNGKSCRFAHGQDDIRAPADTDDCSTNAGSEWAVSKSGETQSTRSSCTGASKASSNASSPHRQSTTSSCTGTSGTSKASSHASSHASSPDRSARTDPSRNDNCQSGPSIASAETFERPSASRVRQPMFVQFEQPSTSDNYSMGGIGGQVNAANSVATSLSDLQPSLDRIIMDLQRLEGIQQAQQAQQQKQQEQQQLVQQQWLQEQQQQERASQLFQQFDMACRAQNTASSVGRQNSAVGVGEGMARAIASPEHTYDVFAMKDEQVQSPQWGRHDIFANAIGALTEQCGRMEQQMQNLMASTLPPTRGGAVAANTNVALQELWAVPPDQPLRNVHHHVPVGFGWAASRNSLFEPECP